MAPTNDNLNKSFFSTQKKLLINNQKIPALARFFEEKDKLCIEYVDWLKSESLANNICYLDLTFEVPSKEPTTLSIVSKDGFEKFLIYAIKNIYST